MEDGVSYYSILNVPREASSSEIKRAYKNLAQTFHPDKHNTAALRENAASEFSLINEAYEVLSHPQKRQVYDIYGKQGLVAGLDVGSKLKSVEELKAEWEKFRAERGLDSIGKDITHSTSLQCLVDCTSLTDPYAPSAFKTEIESIMINSFLDKKLTPHHAAWIGGSVMYSHQDNSGNLCMGCRGMVDPKTGYSSEVQWGTKTEISFQTTHQLNDDLQGAISTSYSPLMGAGLTLSSTQILTGTARATASLVLSPAHQAGVQLALNQRTEDISISTKVQVGAVYGLKGSVVKVVTPTVSFRAIGRFGFTAIDADVGIVKKFSDHSNVTLSVIYGIQGTYLKTKWVVGNYSLDVPIVFSRDPEEWKVALATVTLMPLSVTLLKHFVFKPLWSAYRSRQANQERLKHAERIRNQILAAESAQNLQKSVAQRLMNNEALKSGLVVIKAEFGCFDNKTKANTNSSPPNVSFRKRNAFADSENETMPPAVMDVTSAVQYLVSDSQLELFEGISKSGLMGFCDLAPGQPKTLKIQYLYRNRAYTAEVGDKDALKLPQQGILINNLHAAEDVQNMAKASGFVSEGNASS